MMDGAVEFAVSPAVMFEDVLKRKGVLGRHSPISVSDIEVILDHLCSKAARVAALPFQTVSG
jgi:hypothetical protein